MAILTKNDNITALNMGMFGNKLRFWTSPQTLVDSGFKGTVTVRDRQTSGLCFYRVNVQDAASTPVKEPYFNESAPDSSLVLQGEVQRDHRYLTLFYSTMQAPMRTALREDGQHAYGLKAVTILKHFLWPSSYDDLWALFDVFDDHVIEFSAYRSSVGDCKNRNTVIWEVRQF